MPEESWFQPCNHFLNQSCPVRIYVAKCCVCSHLPHMAAKPLKCANATEKLAFNRVSANYVNSPTWLVATVLDNTRPCLKNGAQLKQRESLLRPRTYIYMNLEPGKF